MNQIAIIHQQRVLNKDFAVYGAFDNPLFLAKDVADCIEHSQTARMIQSVDEDEKVMNIVHTPGGPQSMWFLTEDGLYEVLMQSRKPIAKQFKKQVKTILKEIRANGAYVHANEDDDETIIMAKGLLAAQRAVERKNQLIAQQQQVIDQQKPKVIFAEAIQGASTSILVGDMAKILQQNGIKIGPNKLFEWLREKGYLIKRKGTDYNMPTQYSMQLGLFSIKETPVHRTSGDITISKTPKVTGKGQAYFINKFLTGVETA